MRRSNSRSTTAAGQSIQSTGTAFEFDYTRRKIHAAGPICMHTKLCIVLDVVDSKPVEFRGSSLEDLRAFPPTARREAGHQLDQVQHGWEPDDWKPMNAVGQGVNEIRIRDDAGAFRVLYVAKFADAIHVLHCFQKKTGKTSKADVELAARRYRELIKERGE